VKPTALVLVKHALPVLDPSRAPREWRLGSALYIVWTEQRYDGAHPGQLDLGRDTRALFRAPPDDVFLVKISYWFGS